MQTPPALHRNSRTCYAEPTLNPYTVPQPHQLVKYSKYQLVNIHSPTIPHRSTPTADLRGISWNTLHPLRDWALRIPPANQPILSPLYTPWFRCVLHQSRVETYFPKSKVSGVWRERLWEWLGLDTVMRVGPPLLQQWLFEKRKNIPPPCLAMWHPVLSWDFSRIPASKKALNRCQNHGDTILLKCQNSELNKPLLLINHLVCGIQLQQQKTAQHNILPYLPNCLLEGYAAFIILLKFLKYQSLKPWEWKKCNTWIEADKTYNVNLAEFVDTCRFKVTMGLNFYGRPAQKTIARFQKVYLMLTFMRKEYF